ncbi:MAG: hypothetical protein ACKPKO_52960, partial [Candidatus Fonsibacter sp.]
MQLRPSKIEGYGRYAWTKGAAERFQNIPKLPDELFEMIKVARNPRRPPEQPPPQEGPLRRPHQQQRRQPPPPRSCRISRLCVAASPSP